MDGNRFLSALKTERLYFFYPFFLGVLFGIVNLISSNIYSILDEAIPINFLVFVFINGLFSWIYLPVLFYPVMLPVLYIFAKYFLSESDRSQLLHDYRTKIVFILTFSLTLTLMSLIFIFGGLPLKLRYFYIYSTSDQFSISSAAFFASNALRWLFIAMVSTGMLAFIVYHLNFVQPVEEPPDTNTIIEDLLNLSESSEEPPDDPNSLDTQVYFVFYIIFMNMLLQIVFFTVIVSSSIIFLGLNFPDPILIYRFVTSVLLFTMYFHTSTLNRFYSLFQDEIRYFNLVLIFTLVNVLLYFFSSCCMPNYLHSLILFGHFFGSVSTVSDLLIFIHVVVNSMTFIIYFIGASLLILTPYLKNKSDFPIDSVSRSVSSSVSSQPDSLSPFKTIVIVIFLFVFFSFYFSYRSI